jgi:EAL domain-containing protein (putative c-di-GMP-specific phosphodiesterase class I)
MMPVRSLKIDKSFIMQLDSYEHSRALVEGIVALGHALELTVVAEGVEDASILEFLREVGCDSYQGYLFSPPLPVEEFWQRLR